MDTTGYFSSKSESLRWITIGSRVQFGLHFIAALIVGGTAVFAYSKLNNVTNWASVSMLLLAVHVLSIGKAVSKRPRAFVPFNSSDIPETQASLLRAFLGLVIDCIAFGVLFGSLAAIFDILTKPYLIIAITGGSFLAYVMCSSFLSAHRRSLFLFNLSLLVFVSCIVPESLGFFTKLLAMFALAIPSYMASLAIWQDQYLPTSKNQTFWRTVEVIHDLFIASLISGFLLYWLV